MKGCLKWGAIGIAFLFVVGIIVVAAGGGGTSTTQTGRPAEVGNVAEVAQDPATPTPEWMAPSFGEMCDTNDTMTDLQQEDYAASMAGKKVVSWIGKVHDVQSSSEGMYTVQVDMRGGLFKTRQIEILNIPRDMAASLNVDQEIRFDGTIKSVDMFASDICNPVNIIEATISPS